MGDGEYMPPRQSLIHQQNLWKTFFVFLLPLIATNILQNLSGTINTIFVGQMMGVDAIAAVSVFFPILFLLLAFIIGISTGTTVLVGQAWGAQNIEKVQSVVGSTLFMTIIGGIITAIIGVFFAHDILELLGTDPKVMHLSLPYVQWMLAGSPLLFVYIIYTSILRGVGDSTTPLLALALTSVIGLVITPILLKGYFGLPALGIIAPAIATITGYVAILIFLAIYLNKKNHPLRPTRQLLQHIRHNPELSKIILRLGVPTGIQMITTSMAGLVIVGLVNHYGSHATAAYGAVNQVLNYIQFPAISISIAASIFAAQAIGAGAIFASIMRASGTVTVPMLINISAILFIEIPCAYWFSSMWGLKGIWVAYALAFVSLCIIQGLYYQFIWKKKTIKVLI